MTNKCAGGVVTVDVIVQPSVSRPIAGIFTNTLSIAGAGVRGRGCTLWPCPW